ncbi:MAG: KUP/HAK/KT family potassium transporter, partial [Bacteroidales bacterium]
MNIEKNNRFTISGILLTLGIVFSAIGIAPLYVFNAVISLHPFIDTQFIFGVLSCIIWILTLQATLKYVVIALKADNNGEGGIFTLYTLIRRRNKGIYILAIIGACTFLSEIIIVPGITVFSAIEGISLFHKQIPLLPISLCLIASFFLVQQFFSDIFNRYSGYAMILWFIMITGFGLVQILEYPQILLSFNPTYALDFIINNPLGLFLFGILFLCVAGVESIYAHLGNSNISSIRILWLYVKAAIIISFLGQGAWILQNKIYTGINPFFAMFPTWFLIPAIIISVLAALAACQSLLNIAYNFISEAISLNFWPRLKIKYPSTEQGQMYIGVVNGFIMISSMIILVLYPDTTSLSLMFGASISISFIITSILLSIFLWQKEAGNLQMLIFISMYGVLELLFILANSMKLFNGALLTIFLSFLLFIIMYSWYNAGRIRNKFLRFYDLRRYIQLFSDISQDNQIPKYASNLVIITRALKKYELEDKFIYSLFYRQPKRADTYWILNVDISDEPYRMDYEVFHVIPGVVIRIDFTLGFKIPPKVNKYFMQVVEELTKSKEFDLTSRYSSLKKMNIPSDFIYVMIERILNNDADELKLFDG